MEICDNQCEIRELLRTKSVGNTGVQLTVGRYSVLVDVDMD
jgi:hypothetical protein